MTKITQAEALAALTKAYWTRETAREVAERFIQAHPDAPEPEGMRLTWTLRPDGDSSQLLLQGWRESTKRPLLQALGITGPGTYIIPRAAKVEEEEQPLTHGLARDAAHTMHIALMDARASCPETLEPRDILFRYIAQQEAKEKP